MTLVPDKDAGVGTLLHEIAHALEMLHKCGLADVTEECACCVSYKTDWLLDVEGKPQKWKKLPRGYRLCYKHIKAIRESHLEEVTQTLNLKW